MESAHNGILGDRASESGLYNLVIINNIHIINFYNVNYH